MLLSQAKKFVGSFAKLTYRERHDETLSCDVKIFDIGFIPLLGSCLLTNAGEFRLDRVVELEEIEIQKAA